MAITSDRNIPPNPFPKETVWTGTHVGLTASTEPFLDRRNSILIKEAVNDITETLKQRGNRYGKFTGHAKITQSIKSLMHGTDNWKKLSDDQKESLEMIAHKIGRILNGDPNYDDSWIDIGGYSKLVADRLTTGTEV